MFLLAASLLLATIIVWIIFNSSTLSSLPFIRSCNAEVSRHLDDTAFCFRYLAARFWLGWKLRNRKRILVDRYSDETYENLGIVSTTLEVSLDSPHELSPLEVRMCILSF